MVRTVVEERAIDVPSDVSVNLEGKKITIKGPLGELKKDFSHAPVIIEKIENKIAVKSYWAGKIERSMVGTVLAQIENMIKGVKKGFTYKLKIVFSHFPVNVKVQPNRLVIENFIGERSPRFAKIIGNTKVIVKGDEISVQGIDLNEVSQTAANIESATKIKKKDPRVFLDGIYVFEKKEGI